MADDVSAIIQEIMELTGDKQIPLARKLGVGQSTLNRWLHRINVPNKKQWDRVLKVWRDAKGIKMSIDQKIAHYDIDTQLTVHQMVDNYLRTIPKARR